jgi:hypothetical protein
MYIYTDEIDGPFTTVLYMTHANFKIFSTKFVGSVLQTFESIGTIRFH